VGTNVGVGRWGGEKEGGGEGEGRELGGLAQNKSDGGGRDNKEIRIGGGGGGGGGMGLVSCGEAGFRRAERRAW